MTKSRLMMRRNGKSGKGKVRGKQGDDKTTDYRNEPAGAVMFPEFHMVVSPGSLIEL